MTTFAFPHETIGVISGAPTYEKLQTILKRLNGNAASVKTDFHGGQMGMLGLTVSDAEYQLATTHHFVPPIDPGFVPTYPGTPTAAQVRMAETTFKQEKAIFDLYSNAETKLKQQLINAIPEAYINSLRHSLTGYANVTTKQLVTHLRSTYGEPTPKELEDNRTTFHAPYDVDSPMVTLYQQVEDAATLAEQGNIPYTTEQILQNAYALLLNTGVYNDACKDWRKKPNADKTWANFKIYFTQAEKDYRHDQTTSRQQGYHQANAAIIQQHAAIANLAQGHTTNQQLLQALSTSNQQLMEQLSTRDQQFSTMQNQLQALLTSNNNPPTRNNDSNRNDNNRNDSNRNSNNRNGNNRNDNNGGGRSGGNNERRSGGRNGRQSDRSKYCHTHGSCAHIGAECNSPGDNHQAAATVTNRMGGSTWNVPACHL